MIGLSGYPLNSSGHSIKFIVSYTLNPPTHSSSNSSCEITSKKEGQIKICIHKKKDYPSMNGIRLVSNSLRVP